MHGDIVSYVLQVAGYLTDAGLILYIVRSSQLKKQVSVVLYVICLLTTGLGRTCVLQRFGLTSHEYFYVYWSTDFLLVLSAFVLVCLFFRRACLHEEKMWRFIRLLLLFIFALVMGVSALTLSRNYAHLFTQFIVEFNQNLYFACLVLNTLLYILLQQINSADEQLGLLVCGIGIQFAGPAATLALVHLTTGQGFTQWLGSLVMRLCTLGMLLVWAYAIVRVQDTASEVARRKVPVLAEVTADLSG